MPNSLFDDNESLATLPESGDIGETLLTPEQHPDSSNAEKFPNVTTHGEHRHVEFEDEANTDIEEQTERPNRSFFSRFFPREDDLPERGVEHEQLPEYTEEASQIVRSFTNGQQAANGQQVTGYSGDETPEADRYNYEYEYVPPPDNYKPSIFGAILTSKLNDLQSTVTKHLDQIQDPKKHRKATSGEYSTSGAATPKRPKWYETAASKSTTSFLVQAGLSSASPAVPESEKLAPPEKKRPKSGLVSSAVDIIQGRGRPRTKETVSQYDQVVAEVADIIARRRYLIKLCTLFMKYGAPSHRIEDYLASSARALRIDADFMYVPGAMMCTFIDHTVHNNSVELVRKREGLDFGRLSDAFNVYKCVIHERFTAVEGIAELERIDNRPESHGLLFHVMVYGLAAVVVGPFSFATRPIDFAPSFILGAALGWTKLKVIPRSDQFANVFEVIMCIAIAFISRGLGSIKDTDGSDLFCFSGIYQSGISMILPGFMMLNSALELQSRNMVSGSVRMVYTIVYVLFLGFGLLIGTTFFGLIKRDATSATTCTAPPWFTADNNWRLIYTNFLWVPLFACCVAIICKAKWKQLPTMAVIAVCGHQANFWISKQIPNNIQVANTVGALVIGCLANLYSRLFHGLAAASMLPAIWVLVPGGLASSGSLVAGVETSNQLLGNSTTSATTESNNNGGVIFNAGYGMVQVAIAISVGLYLSALFVYPYTKRKSGLFSF